jgi:hypothetical protein
MCCGCRYLVTDGCCDSAIIPLRICVTIYIVVQWVPCHHSMAHPQDGGDGLQIWRVAANILNKQSRTADKGGSSILRVERGANKNK